MTLTTALAFVIPLALVLLVLLVLRGASRNDPRCPNCDQPMSSIDHYSRYRAMCSSCGFKERRFHDRPAAGRKEES